MHRASCGRKRFGSRFMQACYPLVATAKRRATLSAVLLSLGLGGPATADTLNVDGSDPACDDGVGTPYCTIQAAIDDAVDTDEIVVAEGTYFENINFNGQAITLRSTDPLDPVVVAATIIDANGEGTVVTCDSGEGPDTVLTGFTITGGNAADGGGMRNSGGSSPTVTHCTLTGNTATYGGGMANSVSSPTVTNCTFDGNTAELGGGGMDNFSGSHPTVTNCLFISNSASTTSGGGGGGMHNESNCNPTVSNCMFSGNTASYGGGMRNFVSSNSTVTNCTFRGNTAIGGGMRNGDGTSPTITNCIFWGNSDEITGAGTPLVTFSDVQGGFVGEGNIDADPLFVDPENDDLHFLPGSPCIDAASNDGVPADAADLDGDGDTDEPTPLDLDGNPRFHDDPAAPDCPQDPGACGTAPIVDMGAYESQADKVPDCEGDANGDGVVNPLDTGFVLSRFGCSVGTGDPGCDAADQNGDGVVDPRDTGYILPRFGPCD